MKLGPVSHFPGKFNQKAVNYIVIRNRHKRSFQMNEIVESAWSREISNHGDRNSPLKALS